MLLKFQQPILLQSARDSLPALSQITPTEGIKKMLKIPNF